MLFLRHVAPSRDYRPSINRYMPTITPRVRRLSLYLALLAVVALAAVLYVVDPAQSSAAPKCLVKTLTGYSCPGCGLQRAVHAFLHGDIVQAARYNLFLLIAVPWFLAVVVSDCLLHGAARRRWQRVTHSNVLIYGYIALYFIWWIVRNVYHL